MRLKVWSTRIGPRATPSEKTTRVPVGPSQERHQPIQHFLFGVCFLQHQRKHTNSTSSFSVTQRCVCACVSVSMCVCFQVTGSLRVTMSRHEASHRQYGRRGPSRAPEQKKMLLTGTTRIAKHCLSIRSTTTGRISSRQTLPKT